MFTHPRSYRVFGLVSILSLLLNLISPLSIVWKTNTALAAVGAVAPISTGDDPELDSAVSQVSTHTADAANQTGQNSRATVAAPVQSADSLY